MMQEKVGSSGSSVAPSTSSTNGNTCSSGRGNPVTDLHFVDKSDIGLLSKNISALKQAEKLTALKNIWKPKTVFQHQLNQVTENENSLKSGLKFIFGWHTPVILMVPFANTAFYLEIRRRRRVPGLLNWFQTH